MTDPDDRTSPPAGETPPADADGPPPADSTPPGRPTAAVDPPPAAAVEPAPSAEVEPAPTAEVEPAPATEVEPAPAVAPVATAPVSPAGQSKPREETDTAGDGDADSDDLEPIPRWVGLVTTLGVGLVVVMGAWVVAAIIQGLYYPGRESESVQNDLLHRLGTGFVPTHWAMAMVVLIIAVVLLSLPVLLEEDVTYGQERAASVALVFVVIIAVITCLGAVLAVRASLHAITAQGQAVPTFYRVDRTAYLLAVLGTGILAVYGALVARGMRYGNE